MSSSSNNLSKRFNGKVAVVTASTNGIGLAIAERLAMEGADVLISSRKLSNIEKAIHYLQEKGLSVSGIKCHVANADDRRKLFETVINRYGGLDIFVSNAAVNPHLGNFLDCSEEKWDKIFDVNLKSSFLLAVEAVPLIKKRGSGSIIFISTVGAYNLNNFISVYSVSKIALIAMTKTLAYELAKENIRVNCVAPGLVETNFSKVLREPKNIQHLLALIPMKRVAQPSEIGGIVAFLASEDASYITGETIVAAGGQQSRL